MCVLCIGHHQRETSHPAAPAHVGRFRPLVCTSPRRGVRWSKYSFAPVSITCSRPGAAGQPCRLLITHSVPHSSAYHPEPAVLGQIYCRTGGMWGCIGPAVLRTAAETPLPVMRQVHGRRFPIRNSRIAPRSAQRLAVSSLSIHYLSNRVRECKACGGQARQPTCFAHLQNSVVWGVERTEKARGRARPMPGTLHIPRGCIRIHVWACEAWR